MADPQCDFLPNTRCKTYLTRGQTVGLVITAETGLISIAAVLFLFWKIIRNVTRNFQSPPQGRWRMITSPLEVYMLSLFVADLIQGIGISFNIRWIIQGTVGCGSYCTTQGVIQQLGETTVALSTLAIAVHTFLILIRRGSDNLLVAALVVCIIWVYVILFVSISAALHTKGDDTFDTPTPYWCWVGSKFTAERIAGEYFWFWFTGIVSIILYVLLYFRLRGQEDHVNTGGKWWWRIKGRQQPEPDAAATAPDTASSTAERPQGMRGAAKEAFKMLLYPICYLALILPLSIVRWIDFVLEGRHPTDPNDVRQNIPSAATFVVISIFGLSGIVNVTLFLVTRSGLPLLSEPPPRPAPGPGYGFSSVVSESREQGSLRMRTLAPAPNLGSEEYMLQGGSVLG